MSVCGCYLQVVEDEKQCFCGQSLVEFYRVRVMRWYLMVEGQGGTWVPHQILSEDKQKWGQKFQRTGWRREVSTERDICTHTSINTVAYISVHLSFYYCLVILCNLSSAAVRLQSLRDVSQAEP